MAKAEQKEIPNDIQVREYRPTDYTSVKEILEEAGIFDPVWDSEESLSSATSDKQDFLLIAEVDTQPVGVVIQFKPWGHGGFIFHLAVIREYRHRGIGSKLVEEAENRLRRSGAKEVAAYVDAYDEELIQAAQERGWKIFGDEFKTLVKKL